jgi:dihydroorotate dehydrogenase (fumarate)
MPVICSNGGFAGLSGPAVKYTALANVKKMRDLLDPTISVVGVGGVQSGKDVFDMILWCIGSPSRNMSLDRRPKMF